MPGNSPTMYRTMLPQTVHMPFGMTMRAVMDAEAERRAMLQARQQAGQVLYDQFSAPQAAPQVAPPPSVAPSPPAAPPPGVLSPGGGNPQAQQGQVAPPPMMNAGGGPSAPQAAPAAPALPRVIPPFQPMPTSAPSASVPGEVPPPPVEATEQGAVPDAGGAPVNEPKPMNVQTIVQGLKQAGVPASRVMNILDTLTPTMNTQNQREVAALKAETAAQLAGHRAYKMVMDAHIAQLAEQRRKEAETRKATESAAKVKYLEARAQAVAGGETNLKGKPEMVYPMGENGQPDTTQAPIGTRAVTKTGKILYLDVEGRQVPTLTGATAAQAKAGKVNVRDTVRSNLVEGSAQNALRLLDEIQAKNPNGTVSLLFGKSAGDSVALGAAHALARGQQSKDQQNIDARWAAFIDEAIPVFTGGLRGSDAFRRFLIEQAPQAGTKKETIAEKMRLFRENIAGTRDAFRQKFVSDPKMWGEGVTKDQVQGGGAAPGAAKNAPAVGTVQDGYRFKGGDPSKPASWEKVR